MKRSRWSIAAMVLVVSASITGRARPAPPETTLAFAWPSPAEATVTYRSEILRTESRGTTRSESNDIYQLTVRREGNTLRLERSAQRGRSGFDMAFTDAMGKPLPQTDEVQELLDQAAERILVVIVTTTGDFVAIGGEEELLEQMASALARSHLPADVQQRMRALFTPDSIRSTAADWWNSKIAMWRGRPARPGEEFRLMQHAAFPGVGSGLDIEVVGTVKASVPCPDGQPGCLELTSTSNAKPDQVARALRASGLYEDLEGIDLQREMTLVVRPETLQPQHIRLRVSASLKRRSGVDSCEEAVRTWGFAWAPSNAKE